MVRINPSITLELEKGEQRITIDLKEAKEIIRSLSKFVKDNDASLKANTTTRSKRTRKNARKSYQLLQKRMPAAASQKISHMSYAKKKEILDHVNKQLSAKPRTLSNLLEGVSYVPNHLPQIRKMIEDQKHVSKKAIGKRIFYYRSS
jgi:vacuolar-type H+-ATPase subunit E/Vma4